VNISCGNDNANGQYLEQFVFDPDGQTSRSKIQVPPRKSHKGILGDMVQLLAQTHGNQGQASYPSWKMVGPIPQNMEMV
jgi:hypothetical protein